MSMIGRALALAIWKLVPPKREPDFLIGSSEDDPYMRRWWIIPRNKFFNIYLHHMRHDDDDRVPHDHPWWSLSLCLDGHIREHQLINWRDHPYSQDVETYVKKPEKPFGVEIIDYLNSQLYRVNEIHAGDFKWRGTKYAHHLTLPDGEAWTLFITGPNVRTWGFHCPKGWIPWKQFVDSDQPGQLGRGCGEGE